MELVSDVEEDETQTQFHVDMEQEPEITSPEGGAHATLGQTSHSDDPDHDKTTPTDGCRGGDEVTPPTLGPSFSKCRVMRSCMSETLDIQMAVLLTHMKTTCFNSGTLHT